MKTKIFSMMALSCLLLSSKKAVLTYGFKYGSQYITDYWNDL